MTDPRIDRSDPTQAAAEDRWLADRLASNLLDEPDFEDDDPPDMSMFEGDRHATVTVTYEGEAATAEEAALHFQEWVAMMSPADLVEFVRFDPLPEAPPISDADIERIVTEYVTRVRGNTSPAWDATHAVLAAINGEPGPDGTEAIAYDIVMELSETAHDLGIACPDYDEQPDELDAWNDRLFDALPIVAERLRG